MDAALLEEIGLTKSEIKVYLALLELGSSSTGPIVDKAKVTSSKIYEVLDRLMQKGLVSYILKGKTKYFEAASPERIADYLEEKKELLEKQESEIKKLIPELKLKQSLSKYKQEAVVFKGLKGAQTAFMDILTTLEKGDEYHVYVVTKLTPVSRRWMLKFHKMRAEKGIKVKMLFNENVKDLGEERAKIPLTEVKYVQASLATPAVFNVYKDKTIINFLSTGDYWNVLIKSKEFADSFRSYFNMLWDSKVMVYEGFKNVQQIFNSNLDEMKAGDEYYVIGANWGEEDIPGIREFFAGYHRRRVAKGIKANFLWNYNAKGTFNEYHEKISRIGFLPQGMETPIQINVYTDKIYIILWKEPGCTGFGIQDKVVADSFRQYFESMWKLKVE